MTLTPGHTALGQLHGHANRWYLTTLNAIVTTGDKVHARGRDTWEWLHVLTRLPDPRKRVLTIPYRRANPFFQAAETVWILAGRSDADWITYYNSQLAQYLDGDAQHFHGAYGERLRHASPGTGIPMGPVWRDQLKDVVTQLQRDPGSRRAVATIHEPWQDHPDTDTKDRPCNLALTYQLRQGQLWAATFNRSNDVNLGLAYTNIVQFTVLQEFLAARLSADVGEYSHFSSSLHVYSDDPIVQRLLDRAAATLTDPDHQTLRYTFDVYDYVAPTAMARWPACDAWAFVDWFARNGRVTNDPVPVACPYWRSMVHLMRAWRELKESDALARAAYEVAQMETADWRIACWEYLHRWACKRNLRDKFRELYAALEPIEQDPAQADRRGPVADYVCHDLGV